MTDLPQARQFMRHSWLLLGLLTAAFIMLSLGGDDLRLALRYDRDAILQDQYWRLMTGHFVHGGWRHVVLNIAALWIMRLLFPKAYTTLEWLLIGLVSMAAIDAGFWWLEPQLRWYVGFSGILHGVLAAGAVMWWRTEPKLLALALSAVLVGKLLWEQWQGALPMAGDMPVVVDAHLYGAIGGLLMGLVLQYRKHKLS